MATNVNILDRAPQFMLNAMRTVLAPFEDPTGLARPLWRDGSRYQWPYNFDVAQANGVYGIVWRAGISWGYKDYSFPLFWQGIQGRPMYRSSYHVLYPDQLMLPQADSWYAAHPEIDVLPRVIDLEVSNGAPATQIADVTWDMSEKVLSRDGVRPWIYSRYLLINSWLASWTPAMLNAHYYILAQYLSNRVNEHPGPPTLPNRITEDRILLHQTADKKPGFPGEAPSASVDYDRWERGDEQEMHAFIASEYGGSTPPPPPPPPPCNTLPTAHAQTGVRIRRSPSQDAEAVGSLTTGEKITVIDIHVENAARIWLRHSRGWSAAVFDGAVLMLGGDPEDVCDDIAFPDMVARVNTVVREAPDKGSASVGALVAGEVIEVVDLHIESAYRVWVKHSTGWSASTFDWLWLLAGT